MSDDTVSVKIAADASGVKAGTQTARDSMTELGRTVNQVADAVKSSSSGMVLAIKGIGTAMQVALGSVQAAGSVGAESLSKLHEASEAAEGGVQGLKGVINNMGAVVESAMAPLLAFTAILGGGQFFKEAISDTTAFYKEAAVLGRQMGTSANEAAQLGMAVKGVGGSVETFGEAATMMTRQIRVNEDAVKKMGLATRDADGNYRDTKTLMMDAIAVLNQYKEGTDRNLAAQVLFGRGAANLGPILKLNNEKLEEAKKKQEELGLTITKEGQAKTAAYRTAMIEVKEVMEGLMVTIGSAVLPIFTSLGQWFAEEGPTMVAVFKTAFNDIGAVFSAVGEIIKGINDGVLQPLYEALSAIGNDAAQTASGAMSIFGGVIQAVEPYVKTVASVITGVLTAAFVGYSAVVVANAVPAAIAFGTTLFTTTIPAAYATVTSIVSGIIPAMTALISSTWAEVSALIALDAVNPAVWIGAAIGAVAGLAAGFAAWLGWLDPLIAKLKATWEWVEKFLHLDKAFAVVRTAFSGLTSEHAADDYTPKGEKGFTPTKQPKPKKEKDDLVQQLEAELAAKKMAWAAQQDAQDGAQEYSLQSEASFWKSQLQRTDLSAKDKLSIEQKYLSARQTLIKEGIAKQIEAYKLELADAGGNSATKIAILTREKAFIVDKFGAESKEAIAAQTAITTAEREASKQRQQIAMDLAKAKQAYALAAVDEAEAAAKSEVDICRMTQGQLMAQERAFENQRYAIRAAALKAELKLVDPARDPIQFNKISAEIQAADQAHQNALTANARKAVLQRTQIERAGISSVSQSWGSALAQMATGQLSFANGIKAMWQGMMSAITGAITSMIQQWLEKQLAALLLGRIQQGITAAAQVTSNAAVAASAAIASTAAIPIIGPELAPAAGAAAFSAAMAFAPLASARGGWGDVPFDGAMTELHKNEMVLPADIATPLRQQLKGGGPSGGAGGGFAPSAANDRGGDTPVHLHFHNPDAQGARRLFMDNKDHLVDALRKAIRDGKR